MTAHRRGPDAEGSDESSDAEGLREPDDLAALYDRHARGLHRYLARRAGLETADDLVAETFLVLWERRRGFDPERASLRAWLYGIATNLVSGSGTSTRG